MTVVRVFDPAMCCSSGVCGPSIDPQLARFAADLDWLQSRGVAVERFNLAQQPAAFLANAAVKTTLETKGEAGLPVVEVDGAMKSSGSYPSREQLADWVGVSSPATASATRRPGLKLTVKSDGCCEPTGSASPADKKSGCC